MDRRMFLAGVATLAAGEIAGLRASPLVMKKRAIPVSGELLPIVGIGTSRAFDVAQTLGKITPLKSALDVLFKAGGTFVDTASVYGRAEENIGYLLGQQDSPGSKPFLSTKILAPSSEEGVQQIMGSFAALQTEQIDLLSVHNMVGLNAQLKLLRDLKASGKVRYIGLSHYSDDGIDMLADFIEREPIDFIQFKYTLSHRHAEKRLLSLAQDKGVAVVINQPFSKGMLFQKIRGKVLPAWSVELGCDSWAQFFLKFIVSHPAVNCVIPGTGNTAHALDNIGAGRGHLMTPAERHKVLDYWNNL